MNELNLACKTLFPHYTDQSTNVPDLFLYFLPELIRKLRSVSSSKSPPLQWIKAWSSANENVILRSSFGIVAL